MSGDMVGVQVAVELERLAGEEAARGELRYSASLMQCAAACRKDHLRPAGSAMEAGLDVLRGEYGGLPPGVSARLSELVR